jgi:hypothetical protein
MREGIFLSVDDCIGRALVFVLIFLGGCSPYHQPYQTVQSNTNDQAQQSGQKPEPGDITQSELISRIEEPVNGKRDDNDANERKSEEELCVRHRVPARMPSPADYSLQFVEFDDFGTAWNADETQRVLSEIRDIRDDENLVVVVFVPGWHHNAATEDCHLQGFMRAMAALKQIQDEKRRSDLRYELTGKSTVRLIAIYVGWRGRALPGALDYANVWWRKAAAERVGDGDLSEFLRRLDKEYGRRNTPDKDGRKRTFMGLVLVGHSFGAQVLFRPVRNALEGPLSDLAPSMGNVLNPVASRSLEPFCVLQPVRGLGDMTVLLNPAIESYQFARIDVLYRQLSFTREQTPQLIVISSDSDKARKQWFPTSRLLTAPFRPGFRDDDNDYQSELYKTAFGMLPQQQTHAMRTRPKADDQQRPSSADLLGGLDSPIRDFDFTDWSIRSGIELRGVTAQAADAPPRIPFSPIVVAHASADVIPDHNGIFEEDFRHFLVNYIAFIEAKRAIWARKRAKANTDKLPLQEECARR